MIVYLKNDIGNYLSNLDQYELLFPVTESKNNSSIINININKITINKTELFISIFK